ncbi:hypothetical protein [Planosporangium mesophilum]|uniref:Uncharacterized protein n=1 Tax=Planosporangium mesophilum TaxID=689768 RepID=A0A8J3TCF4_9ACTN|nr:hypothetical protein [Planosporangium mesophilum]NJC83167.1 hypothetical protein [Planosporangium mesophilum]GII22587.1 hypothetical protein Pme01_21840 [Planosporangium mesophilum]
MIEPDQPQGYRNTPDRSNPQPDRAWQRLDTRCASAARLGESYGRYIAALTPQRCWQIRRRVLIVCCRLAEAGRTSGPRS